MLLIFCELLLWFIGHWKDKMKKKVRLPITLKLWKDGKLIHKSVCTKKTQTLARARSIKWEKAYIKVSYCEGLWNDSDHYLLESLETALNAYFEDSLISYAFGGSNEL